MIENHNLHGFDLPFLARRAQLLGVSLTVGRAGGAGLRQRPSSRGAGTPSGSKDDPRSMRRVRYTVPGRELIDTLDAVRRYDFAARDLPGHGLKAVARHLGLARSEREHIPGMQVHEVFGSDPARVRRYAADDVNEAAGVARMLGGAAFALARMAPRRYERLADAGPATGVLDPLLVRAYLRAGAALPAHEPGDGRRTAAPRLHLFATGVARRIVKADVASLYPSLMREYRIGPARDRLGVLLALVDRLVDQRLAAKARARAAPAGSPERYGDEAMSAAMKIVVNSAYGYLGAVGLTRFADVHAANEVTRHGRELLGLHLRRAGRPRRDLARGGHRRRLLRGAGDLERGGRAPRRRRGRGAPAGPGAAGVRRALRGHAVARAEELRAALLRRDARPARGRVPLQPRRALRRGVPAPRAGLPAHRRHRGRAAGLRRHGGGAAAARVPDGGGERGRPAEQDAGGVPRPARRSARAGLRGGACQRAHASGPPGERVRVYRAVGDRAALLDEDDEDDAGARDYDVEYYLRVLRDNFAARMVRAFTPDDFAEVFADPAQPSLFARPLDRMRTILTPVAAPD